MKRPNFRVLLAGLIAALGIAAAWRAFDRSSDGQFQQSMPVPVSGTVQQVLSMARTEITPAPGRVDEAVGCASRRVPLARQDALNLDADALADLAAAFHERLAATVGGDYARSRADLLKRGDSTSEAVALAREAAWRRQAAGTALARFGCEQVEVRALVVRGEPVAPDPVEEGFSTLALTPEAGRFPLPSDAETGKLDVVEVRLPMQKTLADASAAAVVLVGYQFAWHEERSQWIPWRIVIYADPNQPHSPIPL